MKLYKINYDVWTADYGFLNKEILSIGDDIYDAISRAKKICRILRSKRSEV